MSESFNDILLKMLERNPEKRITIAGIRVFILIIVN